MKKLLALLTAAVMITVNCFAAGTVVFTDENGTITFEQTGTATDNVYVKYDSESNSILAKSDKSATGTGTLTLSESCSTDGAVLGLTAKALSDSHVRVKLKFADGNGTQFLDSHAFYISAGFSFGYNSSAYVNTKYVPVNNAMRIEYKFNFTNSSVSVRVGELLSGGNISWSDWVDKAMSASVADFKKITISTEYATADLQLSDVSFSLKQEEETPDKITFSQGSATDNAYVKYDSASNSILAKSDKSSTGTGTLNLSESCSADGAVLGLTAKALSADHLRVKLKFAASNGTQFLDSHAYYNKDGFTFGYNSSAYASWKRSELNEDLRIEYKFDFTNDKIYIRLGNFDADGNIQWSSWVEKAMSASVNDFSKITITTEWATADLQITDVTFNVPDFYVTGALNTEDKYISFKVDNNTSEATNARIVCALYDSNKALIGIALFAGSAVEITTEGITDGFSFADADDINRFKLFVWDSAGINPLAEAYSSF